MQVTERNPQTTDLERGWLERRSAQLRELEYARLAETQRRCKREITERINAAREAVASNDPSAALAALEAVKSSLKEWLYA